MQSERQPMLSNTGNDALDYWIECVNMYGDSLTIEDLEYLLENAPEDAKRTSDYYYMLGWLDMMYASKINE